MSSVLLLPGDPEFDWILSTSKPPGWRQVAEKAGDGCVYLAEVGSGILRAAGQEDLTEYLFGGEYDDRMAELDELEDEEFEGYDLEFDL